MLAGFLAPAGFFVALAGALADGAGFAALARVPGEAVRFPGEAPFAEEALAELACADDFAAAGFAEADGLATGPAFADVGVFLEPAGFAGDDAAGDRDAAAADVRVELARD